MTHDGRVKIARLRSGVPGLDEVLGGGIPEFSFNVVTGSPGAGKTTLALQIAFANATRERPAICFTGLGEPSVKLLRYQQQFDFFDPRRVGVDLTVVNLGDEIIRGHGDMQPVLERITREVTTLTPGIVVIDSFRSIIRSADAGVASQGAIGLDRFMQLLANQLTTWQVTAFLVGEYDAGDLCDPLFTVADGILQLSQRLERSSSMRTLQAVKQRGAAVMAGLHSMRITGEGVHVFPRLGAKRRPTPPDAPPRLSTGVPGLDAMMGGGIPAGDSIVMTGPTGVGKTAFVIELLAAAGQRGDTAVAVVFEEDPEAFLNRSKALGRDLTPMRDRGDLVFIALAPMDLSLDESLHEIAAAAERIDAKAVVVDSLSGFELALAPSFREDFRESMNRLVRSISATGVTVMMTVEVVEAGAEVRSSTRQLSFLAADIIQLRYLEMRGEMRSVLNVVKMRRNRHSRLLRIFEISDDGVKLGPTLREYDSILAHSPERGHASDAHTGLSGDEGEILRHLIAGGQMTAQELADNLSLPVDAVSAALSRMVSLGLAEVGMTPGDDTYRALAQPTSK